MYGLLQKKKILLGVLLFVVIGSSANATMFSTLPYYKWVEFSDVFVKGKIISREKFVYIKEGENKAGWLLNITVNKKWKGEINNFQLLDFNGSTFQGYDLEYIFIARKRSESIEFAAESLIQKLDIDNVYSVRVPEQMIFALDPIAKGVYGGEWMVVNIHEFSIRPGLLNDQIFQMPGCNDISQGFMMMPRLVYPEKYYVRSLKTFLEGTLFIEDRGN